MRIAIQILAILAIAALLAPDLRWAFPTAPAEACACPPQACMCAGHHHASGHPEMCAMANGGRCGISAPDDYLSSTLGMMIYMPIVHTWSNPVVQSFFDSRNAANQPLPSHARIPDQPPRPRA
jgi:hypothetical protein